MSDDVLATAALDRAKTTAGGTSALARALSESGKRISPQAISQWRVAPPERVLELERITGVSRHQLRPDIYGPAATSGGKSKGQGEDAGRSGLQSVV